MSVSGLRVPQEKILVIVRIRPLSSKELAANDVNAWDCIDENTLFCRNLNHDRHSGIYTFDKVFDPSCPTNKIYEQGVRDVALSAIHGINATIFAYGRTSSGKTYTMKGIAENVINDIYSHIENATESKFALRLSALEIYNETVVDLLNRDSSALRLLDDPKKGTVVEKLTEKVIKDAQHLRSLIATCEAQRHVGETCLNDRSSRSHQIIRLTIESSLGEESKSLLASLSLVDLACSEPVSQTNADSSWLKEGSRINRSLLTLTNVIRKLSVGKKSGHIPYRDSKLTRILQSSLGGNARTAIICTISPALSHVEQSRNTLCFATSATGAKEVTNSAQVNMAVAEKSRQLVKHLQKEATRLKAESDSSEFLRSLLLEKEQKIRQMEREMNELKRERDLAQSKELNHGQEIGWLKREENTLASLEEKLENVQKPLDKLVISRTPLKKKKNDGSMPNFIRSPSSSSSTLLHGIENRDPASETELGGAATPWHLVFEERRKRLAFEDKRKKIIMLWHLCHVSIVHRTRFFMLHLFRGDPTDADQMYIEVELQRLTCFDQQLLFSSIKALEQEREYLAKRLSTKLNAEEREMLYRKWEIPMEGKQRKLQLVSRLWTDPLNMIHVRESAELVAQLVGFQKV